MAAKQVIYITGSLTLIAALTVLFLLPGVTIDSSGNISCGPVCESYFNVTSKNKICFNVTEIVQTDPYVQTELYWLYSGKWKLFNLSKDCIPANSKKQFMVIGHKKKEQTVKWGIDALGIDPVWMASRKIILHTFTPNKEIVIYSDGEGMASVSNVQIFANSNGTKLKDIYSFKNCEFCNLILLSIQEDKNHPIEVTDYNMTAIRVRPTIMPNMTNRDIPLKILDRRDYSKVDYEQIIRSVSAGKQSEIIAPFGLDKALKIGEHSTLVVINNSADGVYCMTYTDATWATAHDAATAETTCSSTDRFGQGSGTPLTYEIDRLLLPFNTSFLNYTYSAIKVINATIGAYQQEKYCSATGGTTYAFVCPTTQASVLSPSTADYDQLGLVDNPTICTKTITNGDWTNDVYVWFNLTAYGNTQINMTGWSLFGLRDGFDRTDTAQDNYCYVELIWNTWTPFYLNITFLTSADYVANILSPLGAAPITVAAGDNFSINLTCAENGINLTTNVSGTVYVGSAKAPFRTSAQCTGTLNCSKYSDYQCGWCPSCLWSNKSQSAYIDLFGTPAADWAVWNATLRRKMFLLLDDTTACTNDATDDCACFNGSTTTNQSYLVYKQTNYDLTNCTAGSAWVYFSKLYETGTLETNDCMLIQYSNDSGTTWSGNTSIYCDDSPAATLNISLTNTSMYRSGFRVAIGGQAMDVVTEMGCVDGIIVGCTSNVSCYATNSNTCASCGPTINCTNCSKAGCANTTYSEFAHIGNGIWKGNLTAPDGTIYDTGEYCTEYTQFTPTIFSNVSSSTVTVTSTTNYETILSIDTPAIKNAVYWIIVKSSSYMNKTLGVEDAQTVIDGATYGYGRKYGNLANISANYYTFSTLYNATNYWLNVKLQGRNTAGSISWWNMSSITIIRYDDYPHRDFYYYYNSSEATNLDNVFNNQGLNDVGQLTFTIAQSGLYYVNFGGSCDADNISDNANMYATIDTAAETYPTRNASITQTKGYLAYSEWGPTEEHYDEMFTIKNFSVGSHTINISCAKNNTRGTNITDFKDKNLYVLRLSDVFYFRNYSNGSMQTTNTWMKNLTDKSWTNETGKYIIANNVIARHLNTTAMTDFNLIVNGTWMQHSAITGSKSWDIIPYTFYGYQTATGISAQMQFGNVTATVASPTNTLQDTGIIILLNGTCPILSSTPLTGYQNLTFQGVCNGISTNDTEINALCYGVCEVAGEKDINLSIGPPSTDIFRVTGCGPKKINYSAIPQNQTTTYGIDKLCNNGTGAGKIQVKLSGTPNSGWQVYASNTSPSENLINLTASPTTYKDIYSDIAEDECIYIWYNFTCMNVTANAGVYEIYTIE